MVGIGVMGIGNLNGRNIKENMGINMSKYLIVFVKLSLYLFFSKSGSVP